MLFSAHCIMRSRYLRRPLKSCRSLHAVVQVNRHIRMALHSRTQNSAAAQDMQNDEALSTLDALFCALHHALTNSEAA